MRLNQGRGSSLCAGYMTAHAGTRPEEIAQARAQLAAVQATEAYANARFAEAVVRSPTDGVVEIFNRHPGDPLEANRQAGSSTRRGMNVR